MEADDIGSWAKIGYTGPGSNGTGTAVSAVFGYAEVAVSGDAPNGRQAGWEAKPLSKLNDCTTGEKWALTAKYKKTGEDQGNVGYHAGGDPDCIGLTPAFEKLDDNRGTAD